MRVLAVVAGIVLVCATAVPTAAQTAPAQPKDAGIATLLSVLITGGGQLYTGEVRRGATMLGVGLGSLLIGSALSVSSCDTESALNDGCSKSYAALGIGTVVYLGTWIYGIVDAPKSADRQNARLQRARVTPRIEPGVRGTQLLGVSLLF